jgi:hypothetical protein
VSEPPKPGRSRRRTHGYGTPFETVRKRSAPASRHDGFGVVAVQDPVDDLADVRGTTLPLRFVRGVV